MNDGLLHIMEDSNVIESAADKEIKDPEKYTNEGNQCMRVYVV